MGIDRFIISAHPIAIRAGLLACFLSWALAQSGCQSIPDRRTPGGGLPEAFRTPQATFSTWVQSTLSGNRQEIEKCYWKGLGKPELEAWLRENLRPEAKLYFRNAELIDVKYRTKVEVNFRFRFGQLDEMGHGVMVRTLDGWKIQSW